MKTGIAIAWRGLLIFLLLGGLAACGKPQVSQVLFTDDDGVRSGLQIADGAVLVRNGKQPPARVMRDGALQIGTKPVAMDAAQRALAAQYYAQTRAIERAGESVGEQGGELAARVVGSLFTALFEGNSKVIKHTADAQSHHLAQQLDVLCRQMSALRDTQDALARAQPAFAPYAVVNAQAVHGCLQGAQQARAAGTRAAANAP